jgi:hypothetical protein
MAATEARAPPKEETCAATATATLATTDAGGSIDRYAAELAAHLGVPRLRSMRPARVDDARAELEARGIARAAEFSWQKAADETRALYERIDA